MTEEFFFGGRLLRLPLKISFHLLLPAASLQCFSFLVKFVIDPGNLPPMDCINFVPLMLNLASDLKSGVTKSDALD